jgi:pimeloyl-ACP methyl ester carboxylesterase
MRTENWMAAIVIALAILVLWLCARRLRGIRGKGYAPWRRIAEPVILCMVMIVALLVGGSTAYNAVATYRFWAQHSAPGQICNVGGYKMHIYCMGQGSPTIVLDAGLGNDSLVWGKVQPELAKTTRVCAYDRAGFGWSDFEPAPQDANKIADQLHGLLNAAGITGPIVLMGHSIAGIYIRDYAAKYPENLAGLILVDGSTPLQDDREPFKSMKASFHDSVPRSLIKLPFVVGVLRLKGMCNSPSEGFEARSSRMLSEESCRASQLDAIWLEADSVHKSGEETVHSGPFGDLPILIFSQDPGMPLPPVVPEKLAKELPPVWNGMQEDLKKLSTRSRRIIAKGSSHYVQVDRADLVNDEVTEFIRQIRGEAPWPEEFGTTTTK